MLNVVCVKWGDWCAPHGVRYVNNLAAGVAANLRLPYRFICFTDNPVGLDAGIECRALPLNLEGWWWSRFYSRLRRPALRRIAAFPYRFARQNDGERGIGDERFRSVLPIDLRGWYTKIYLFKPGVLEGPTLYIDLDTVIVDGIDELAAYDGDFCILRDFFHPRRFGSGLIHFRPEKTHQIWDRFVDEGCPFVRGGDQVWIQKCIEGADYFQELFPGHVASYKLNCQGRATPPYTRIICFHGRPRPHEVDEERIVKQFDRLRLNTA